MGAPRGWYIDEDLLDVYKVLVLARRKLGDVHGVLCPCEVCPAPSTKDRDWLPLLEGREWAIITRDSFKTPGERELVRELGLGVFRLRWRRKLESFERVRFVLAKWDEMEEWWTQTPRPHVTAVTRHRRPRLELS